MSDALQLDWTVLQRLLPLCVEFAQEKRHGKKIDLRDAAERIGQELGIENTDEYSVEQLQRLLAEGFGFAFDDDDAKAITAVFVQTAEPVMKVIVQFARKEADATELVRTLNDICLGNTEDLEKILRKSLHLPDDVADIISDQLGPYTVSVYCFAAAFKIYKKAAEDARLAKERRIEIERLADEAIAALKAERSELEAALSGWMLERILPFSEGVSAMDRAILEDDDDAYIAANAELWKLFGRETAYSSASEFDDLMASDNVFRL